jgi:hypothetical protein
MEKITEIHTRKHNRRKTPKINNISGRTVYCQYPVFTFTLIFTNNETPMDNFVTTEQTVVLYCTDVISKYTVTELQGVYGAES